MASGDAGEEHRMDIVSDVVVDAHVLVLQGDFDVRSTWEVRNAIYDLLDVHEDVVVDLTGVRAIDMTALKVLAVATRSEEEARVLGEIVTAQGGRDLHVQ